MPPNSAPPPEGFDELLSWLDENRERATEAYLDLRRGLVKIFVWNQCSDPEGLTDEVFDRVIRKLPGLKDVYEGNPRLYFYGVANNLIKEHRKVAKLQIPLDGIDIPSKDSLVGEETLEMRSECLEMCLKALDAEQGDLILSYYSKERREKFIHRAEMARRLGVSIGALRVRMLRIRANLEECIEHCLDEKMKNA
jgi:DNA-directed RNA polymerase specialized sigma24 family protein